MPRTLDTTGPSGPRRRDTPPAERRPQRRPQRRICRPTVTQGEHTLRQLGA